MPRGEWMILPDPYRAAADPTFSVAPNAGPRHPAEPEKRRHAPTGRVRPAVAVAHRGNVVVAVDGAEIRAHQPSGQGEAEERRCRPTGRSPAGSAGSASNDGARTQSTANTIVQKAPSTPAIITARAVDVMSPPDPALRRTCRALRRRDRRGHTPGADTRSRTPVTAPSDPPIRVTPANRTAPPRRDRKNAPHLRRTREGKKGWRSTLPSGSAMVLEGSVGALGFELRTRCVRGRRSGRRDTHVLLAGVADSSSALSKSMDPPFVQRWALLKSLRLCAGMRLADQTAAAANSRSE